ncbi:histidine--tRNA ligase [Sphingomonas ginkgonis]|uniref:Histidine--tRNA ligase n=1 Tax=Sphingomonas ginkgonis TaxID=2315330 RepID=A0A429V6N1_9SPHN|nr:histidine--tRNA ligase [Sphingomonas ginkgonis]RST29602.1 histidine--tRNA ligase [Sphingomonas ginkgonis]
MAQTNIPQPVRGTQSLLGEDADRFHAVVAAFDRVRRLFGFKRVEVPVIEPTAVFARSLGETTDVVSKEMYSFEDRSGDPITLRPEFTAGIARAYLSEGWQQFAPLKVATHGPAFRYERPQKGRFRQFHQLDAEILGAAEPQADVEVIAFAAQLLKELGLGEDEVVLNLNTLGDPTTRTAWRNALHAHFSEHAASLSEDSRDRLDRNPLRILDSKAPQDRPIADAAPEIDAHLTNEAADYFAAVTAGLDAAGVRWTRASRLVRGLDYYRHTAFEFITDRLGAQGTVLAGGRYDGLMEALGGPPVPAVGWAAGIERLGLMIDPPPSEDRQLVAVIPDTPAEQPLVAKVAARLRGSGIPVRTYLRGNAKKQTERARKEGLFGILFLRAEEHPQGEHHFTPIRGEPVGDADLVARIALLLGPQPAEADGR